MPEEPKSASADVEKLLADEKAIEDRKQALVAELLKQKEAAMKEFDDRLAKLGYRANSGAAKKRSHHTKPAGTASQKPKPKT